MGSLFASSTLSEAEFVDQVALFAALVCVCIVIGHLLEKARWINQSVTALLIGLSTGCLILVTSRGKCSHILEFRQEFFFIYLLPPIIFNAGFKVKKKQFFRNFMNITSFGAIGTLISFAIISYGAALLLPKLDIGPLGIKDYLGAIGAIFSATDSVCTLQVLNKEETPLLHSLVFGEGVVNDATTVVLFNTITNFNLSAMNATAALKIGSDFLTLFMLSTLLGVFVGLLCAYIIRKLIFSHSTDLEVALMILMAYLSYITAEVFKLSGILTVFICGILMSHYTWHNVTLNSQVTTSHSFATMSYIAEVFIFLYVGMDSLDVDKWRLIDSPGKSISVSAILLGLIMVGRAVFVLILSFLSNLIWNDEHGKIKIKQQITIWWAGLMRGAVSVALAYKKFTGIKQTIQPVNALLITSTISVVLFSTVVFGLLTKPFIRWLVPTETEVASPNSSTIPLLGSAHDLEASGTPVLRMLLDSPTNTIHHYWRKFDDSCMRPVFGGTGCKSLS